MLVPVPSLAAREGLWLDWQDRLKTHTHTHIIHTMYVYIYHGSYIPVHVIIVIHGC